MLRIGVSTGAFHNLGQALARTGARLPSAQALVLNRVITRVRGRVVDTLAGQTGLHRRIIAKAVKLRRAAPSRLAAELASRGGDVSLKFFHPHEAAGGADATVRGATVHVAGGFRRAGPQGGRHAVKKLGGHVFTNVDGGKWRGRMRKVKSGVVIPLDMVSGATARAFTDAVEHDLPIEIARELAKILPGRA